MLAIVAPRLSQSGAFAKDILTKRMKYRTVLRTKGIQHDNTYSD
jgi:hypothetical protein